MLNQCALLEERIRAKWDMDLGPSKAVLHSIPSIPSVTLVQGMRTPLCFTIPKSNMEDSNAKVIEEKGGQRWLLPFLVTLIVILVLAGLVWWIWKEKREIILDKLHKLKQE